MFGYMDADKETTGNYGEDGCSEDVVACTCDECGEPIYVGEKYYDLVYSVICEKCLENFAKIGELNR